MVPFTFENSNEYNMNNDKISTENVSYIENQNEFTESTETSGLNFKINV